MSSLLLLLTVILGIIAIVDWLFKEIPSMFLTGILFAVAVIQYYSVGVGPLATGVLACLFALILYDGNFIGGVADIKIIALMGLLVTSQFSLIMLIGLVLILGLIYKLFFRYVLKKNVLDEIPFIPCLYAVYLVILVGGGFA